LNKINAALVNINFFQEHLGKKKKNFLKGGLVVVMQSSKILVEIVSNKYFHKSSGEVMGPLNIVVDNRGPFKVKH